MNAKTACCASVSIGLGLLAAALFAVSPVMAQEGFYISLDQAGTEVWNEGEWKTLSGADQDLNVTFYMQFAQDYESGCIDIEFEYEHDGDTTSDFFRGPVGIYMEIDENQFNGTGQDITLAGEYNSTQFSLDTGIADVREWFLLAEYPDQQHTYNLAGTGTGSATACVTDSDDERPAYVRLYNDDESYYVANTQEISMRWVEGYEPAQTAYTATTGTWDLPGPLEPITYTIDPDAPTPWGETSVIDVDYMWWVAMIALTIYNLLPRNVWVIFLLILMLPIIGIILYRLMVEPPDI